MRGKQIPQGCSNGVGRITPAGAGKTTGSRGCIQGKRDHPRRCGENNIGCLPYTGTVGSPPQVRGKPAPTINVQNANWITPAGAGKTVKIHSRSRKRQDHPRRCGENANPPEQTPGKQGSPPQVRGKPGRQRKRTGTIRKTAMDHPRRCGENRK